MGRYDGIYTHNGRIRYNGAGEVWPRTVQAMLASAPEFPDAVESWGMQGKGQFRAGDNVGRTWQETYNAFRGTEEPGRVLLAAINQARREKTLWEIQHPQYRENYGEGGGTPVVSGADQTGAVLVVAGGLPSVTNWLRAGDLIQFGSSPLVHDVTADVDTDEEGGAGIPISPPIFAGGSPANFSAVEIDAANIFFQAALVGVAMSQLDPTGIVGAGMVLTWREQP